MPETPEPAADLLRARVADADRLRRTRDAATRLWRIAPAGAAACLAIAAVGRLAGWAPIVALGAVAVGALLLILFVVVSRRPHSISDTDAAAIDDHASLNGELRSAHWFASSAERDPWVEFHLTKAVERVQRVDWSALYPAPSAGRAMLATALLTVGALAIALLVPGRAGVLASGPGILGRNAPATLGTIPLEALTPEMLKALDEMLTAAEMRQGRTLTAEEMRGLLDQLERLRSQKGNTPVPKPGQDAAKRGEATAADVKALAERAKRASEDTRLEPEVRDALSSLAEKLSDAAKQADEHSPKDASEAAASKEEAKGEAAQSSSAGNKKEDASSASVKEASAGGGGLGVIMMASETSANSKEAGLGLGGGSSPDKNGGGKFVDLGAALRKETIEASLDNPGENVLTENRRKTERGQASVGFTRAAGTAERGRSTAPPPVPESRRAAVKSYFIRKQ